MVTVSPRTAKTGSGRSGRVMGSSCCCARVWSGRMALPADTIRMGPVPWPMRRESVSRLTSGTPASDLLRESLRRQGCTPGSRNQQARIHLAFNPANALGLFILPGGFAYSADTMSPQSGGLSGKSELCTSWRLRVSWASLSRAKHCPGAGPCIYAPGGRESCGQQWTAWYHVPPAGAPCFEGRPAGPPGPGIIL